MLNEKILINSIFRLKEFKKLQIEQYIFSDMC